jgi:hypothetical protein
MNEISRITVVTNREKTLDDWRAVFRPPPPKYLSKDLMHSILAWERQAVKNGGLSNEVRRVLKEIDRPQKTVPPAELKQGVTLVREWNGRTYQVNVHETGFKMDGKDYTSLSAIAQKITGAKWSGPRFFGLNTKKGVKHA